MSKAGDASADPFEQTVLDLLDPRKGGVWAQTLDGLRERLAERELPSDRRTVVTVLNRLCAARRLERVETEDRGPVYTRPEILLLAPGLVEIRRSARTGRS